MTFLLSPICAQMCEKSNGHFFYISCSSNINFYYTKQGSNLLSIYYLLMYTSKLKYNLNVCSRLLNLWQKSMHRQALNCILFWQCTRLLRNYLLFIQKYYKLMLNSLSRMFSYDNFESFVCETRIYTSAIHRLCAHLLLSLPNVHSNKLEFSRASFHKLHTCSCILTLLYPW